MYTVLAIIIVIASIFLTIIVLVQNDKGGGLAANFASGNQTFGVRQTADFGEGNMDSCSHSSCMQHISNSFCVYKKLLETQNRPYKGTSAAGWLAHSLSSQPAAALNNHLPCRRTSSRNSCKIGEKGVA